MRLSPLLLLLASAAALASVASAQTIRATGKINETYALLCASCHGKNMEGAQAPSMLDDVWLVGGDDESLAKSIRQGFPEKGMPPWGAAIPEKEIRAMVIYIQEQRALHRGNKTSATGAPPVPALTAKSKHHAFRLAPWIEGVIEPWGLTFLTPDRAIVTEKRGYAYLIDKGKLAPRPILGVPVVDTAGQAGLYDVVPHPDFAKNGWIYFAFADPRKNDKGEAVSLTRIIRGKLSKEGALVDQETIYQASLDHYIKAGGVHFGGRIAFDGRGYLYLAIGERGQRDQAQLTDRPTGKIHRLHDDGRVPADNPFAKDPKAVPTLWSYGHRNPQGLAIHPVTGQLFDAEHGPRGGDELNLVEKGKNYGWPVITHGMEYDGKATTDLTHKAGMEQPLTYWVPSIAPCGMNFYTGDKFPQWKNQLFLASLAGQQLVRLEIQGGKVVDQEILFRDLGRIRHVIGGPDGALYVCMPTSIARLTPAE
ncbi:MAG: PQQ-dependent sugar dehydrogenase [Opitutaceae bacterium]|nr:PQQ-dependent sugar dehydrogenase [Opitutaceae bacterium]